MSKGTQACLKLIPNALTDPSNLGTVALAENTTASVVRQEEQVWCRRAAWPSGLEQRVGVGGCVVFRCGGSRGGVVF